MKVPENLLYTKEHEWISKKDNAVKVGITDFAQSQLGDIIFLELPEVGDQIVSGESFGEIEAVKTVSELYAPIDGTILEVNEDLEDSPDNINQDFEYIANKLDITTSEIMEYFNAPNKTFSDYKNQQFIYDLGAKVLRAISLEKGGKR